MASVWILFLVFGCSACLVPVVYTIIEGHKDSLDMGYLYGGKTSSLEFLAMVNGMLFMALGSLIGYPIALASVGALRGLLSHDLVALRGTCPNCGEEVFAFLRSDQPNNPHRADCHVCECSLEFRPKVEQSISNPGRRWVYGRIYLVPQKGRKRRGRWM